MLIFNGYLDIFDQKFLIMKNKKEIKKLSLNKAIVTILNKEQQRMIVGGIDDTPVVGGVIITTKKTTSSQHGK